MKLEELPSHVRVLTGADLEYKCNMVISEEATAGYLLFKTACGICYDDGADQMLAMIILSFRKEEKGRRNG